MKNHRDPNENRLGYKKTKVGWIPDEWDLQPIGSISDVVRGSSPRPAGDARYFNGSFLPWVTVADVTQDSTPFLTSTKSMLTEKGSKYTRIFSNLTLILTNSGATLGVPKILKVRAGANDGIAGFLTLKRVDPLFLYYFLQSRTRFFRERMAPGVGQPNLNTDIIASVLSPVPPLPEQKKIAEVLNAWDRAIELTRKLIEARKKRKKALMRQLLTGKRRLPGFTKPWGQKSIGDLFEEVTRPVEWSDEATYSLLSVRRASGGIFLRERRMGRQIRTKDMYVAQAGDFLISKMQVLHGATALVPPEFDGMNISGSYIALRPKTGTEIVPDFFARLSSTSEFYHRTYLCSYGVHIEKMTFNLEWFLESQVKLPEDAEEQQAIATILKIADVEISLLESTLAKIDAQKRGLMQKLLTGQVRVKINGKGTRI